jgi:hypothetical protein
MENILDISMVSDWEKIEGIREKGEEFFKLHNIPHDDMQALVMVLNELVENAVKYGSGAGGEKEVRLRIEFSDKIITIEVMNHVNGTSEVHLDRLDHMIQWIRGHQNSFESYIERIKEVSTKPFDDEESGLGLARIAYEGKSIVDFFVDNNKLLTVSAIYYL